MTARRVCACLTSSTRFGLAVRAARRDAWLGTGATVRGGRPGPDVCQWAGARQRNPTLTTQERIALALDRALSELVKAAEELQ